MSKPKAATKKALRLATTGSAIQQIITLEIGHRDCGSNFFVFSDANECAKALYTYIKKIGVDNFDFNMDDEKDNDAKFTFAKCLKLVLSSHTDTSAPEASDEGTLQVYITHTTMNRAIERP